MQQLVHSTNKKRHHNRVKTRSFDPQKSLTKAIFYFKDKEEPPATRYSFLNKDKKSRSLGMQALVKLAFSKDYIGRWQTLVIYDNTSGKLITKYVNGKQVAI